LNVLTLYQTLEDRENHIDVEEHGPFICKWENTWLGDGYYFWEEFYHLAEWWGTHRYPSGYIICQAQCDHTEKLFDLVGNMKHIASFKSIMQEMKRQGRVNNTTTVSRVIRFMQAKIEAFNYEAIRVHGIGSLSAHSKQYVQRLIFESTRTAYLDLQPAVQLCLFKKNSLNLREFRVIYPDHYREDYVF